MTAVAAPSAVRPTKRRKGRGSWPKVVLALIVLVFLLFPVYWMVNVSFLPSADLLRANPVWFPVHGTLDGYRKAFDTQLGHLGTSLIVAAGTVVVSLLIATPAAFALGQMKVRGGTIVVFALLVAQMIPTIVMANAIFVLMSDLRLIDNYVGLILADCTATIPFAIIVMRAFMVGMPPELIEAAEIDGAGYLRTFVSVVVPVSRNAIVTAGLFSFLFAWADFLFGVTLTTGQSFVPITVGIYQFVGSQSSDWNAILATSVMASIPAAILLVLAQRFIAAGVTGGAVKD